MGETTEPANPPTEVSHPPQGTTANPLTTETNQSSEPPAETTLPAVEPSLPAIDKTMPTDDTSLPSLPHIDTSLPPMDTSLPAMDSTVPALPSIDTSMPPFDTPLPATEASLPSTEPDFKEESTSDPNAHSSNTHGAPPELPSSGPTPLDNDPSKHSGGYPSTPQFQSVNGNYQYSPSAQHQPSAQQNHDSYHNPQAGSTQVNAPSMENHSQPAHIPQAPIGSPLPSNMPPMSSMGQYMQGYPNNVAQIGMASNSQMRYQIPGDPSKMLSGGRHKKEVKRRTKTGCLTCRKRRIKCDEGHPVCRNCVKSKRECLGYDPVFRPQPTPSAIQPAPNPPPSLVVNPQDPATYPAAPPGYVPAVSQPFAPSLHSESPSTSTEQYEYGTTIDPTLDHNNNNNSSNMASLQSHADGNLQQPVNNATGATAPTTETANFRVKQVRVGDLLALRGIAPPPPHPIVPLQQGRLEEIQAVFLANYAPAIDKFLETRWFQEKALPHLMANAQLMAEYSALIDAFNDRNLSDPNVIARLESFEASVIWSSMTLCRQVSNASNGDQEQNYDLLSASARLDVIEALITGDYLHSNPLAQYPVRERAADPPSLPDQLLQRSLDFWSYVGHFLTLHDNEASSGKEIDDTLGVCRTLLDTYENRDVIYSIAIARHLGQRYADFPRSFPQPITTNEKDSGAKLYVAQKFLEQEAGGKGTTQVIKRICGMVLRSWIVSRE